MFRPRKSSVKRKTIGLISLGCPKNTVDSERLLGELNTLGWTFTDQLDDADCLIVNTCGFIKDAVLESEEALEEISEIKRIKPDVLLIATGCLPQRFPGELEMKFKKLDLVAGAGSLDDLPGLIESLWANRSVSIERERLSEPGRATLSHSTAPRLRISPSWTAYMKIAEGCGHECSFCTIPAIKGPHVSRPVDDLVNEARMLASDGVKELILVSQDTTAYGSDIGTNLRVLLKELDSVDGIRWIRLHYLYPSKVSDGLLDTIAGSRHVIPYFDIPLQHVSGPILHAMKRLDPDLNALGLVGKIRSRFTWTPLPACVRTTLIVGFPGETEAYFEMLVDFVETASIDRLTVFRYSPEDGTQSVELPGEVPEHIAESRMHSLMEAQQEVSLAINQGWLGQEIEVLIEGETDDGRRQGRSYRDAPEIDGLVLVSGVPDEIQPGDFVKVKITAALEYDLEGEWVKAQD